MKPVAFILLLIGVGLLMGAMLMERHVRSMDVRSAAELCYMAGLFVLAVDICMLGLWYAFEWGMSWSR